MTIRRRTEDWIHLLRNLGGEPPEPGARLGAGACDAPLVASIARTCRAGAARGRSPIVSIPRPLPIAREARLWWAVHESTPTPESLPDVRGGGALLLRDDYRAIEVWTECELCALHALRNVVGRDDLEPALRAALRDRLDRAVAWHLEHTQPDNATNRPWSIHVFAERAEPEAQLYAEGLLHACQVGAVHPEPLSQAILLDAARELERRPLGSAASLR